MPASDERGTQPGLVEASDAELIGRAAEGDARSLEVLYDRYSSVVFSFALRLVGDRQLAEEVLQEAFFRAWQQGGAFSLKRGTFITWLLSITHNLAIDEIRKRRRRPRQLRNLRVLPCGLAVLHVGQALFSGQEPRKAVSHHLQVSLIVVEVRRHPESPVTCRHQYPTLPQNGYEIPRVAFREGRGHNR